MIRDSLFYDFLVKAAEYVIGECDDKPLPEVERGCACCSDYPATKACCACGERTCTNCAGDGTCHACKHAMWDLT